MFLGTPRSPRAFRGSSAAKDLRTVEEPVRPVAKWVRMSLDWRLCSALPTYSGQPTADLEAQFLPRLRIGVDRIEAEASTAHTIDRVRDGVVGARQQSTARDASMLSSCAFETPVFLGHARNVGQAGGRAVANPDLACVAGVERVPSWSTMSSMAAKGLSANADPHGSSNMRISSSVSWTSRARGCNSAVKPSATGEPKQTLPSYAHQ